jgi:hypothetical protein
MRRPSLHMGNAIFWFIGIIVIVFILYALIGCRTYQVMDMKPVPKHPRPDSAAVFPMRGQS